MRRIALFAVLLLAQATFALEPASDPNLAVVRIKSHGASGTVISTTDGKSYILSCAHMFFAEFGGLDAKLLKKPFSIDGPAQPYAPNKPAVSRLIGVDAEADLSLIEIDNGPFHYIPIAPQGRQPGQRLLSAGYDDMKWPVTNQWVTILSIDLNYIFTRERPWHGRSGGGLFDYDAKLLFGVVEAYETTAPFRGVYVGHQSILRFMSKYQSLMEPIPARPPSPNTTQRLSKEEKRGRDLQTH